ncbi:MAG: SDR family oxidoreductase [Anaerolineaceae bacterium]|nr:SDR family oxidoreductase [Anaerolineaceae bacterium]
MKTLNLSGKIAIVTGGAGQLGRAMCKGLADCGADVGICYYSQQEYAEELRLSIEQDYKVRALAIKTDVTDLNSILEMKKIVNDRLGSVSILVNNAIIAHEWKKILDQDVESFESQFRSSVLQAVLMAKAFIPDMIQQNYGRVIGINTECAMQMLPYQSAYVSGKRGMDGIYRILAKEIGPHNITVNQIAPGWTLSDNCREHDGTEANLKQDFPYIDTVPLHRRGSDAEVADAVCFLASDLASFISGVYLPVCGGNVMPCI